MKKSRFIAVFALISVIAVLFSGCMTLNIELPSVGTVTINPDETTVAGDAVTNAVPDVTTASQQEQTTADAAVPVTQAPGADNNTPTQAPATQAASNDPLTYSNEQLLSWFNESLNGIKSAKAGFTKTKTTTIPSLTLSNPVVNSIADKIVGTFVKGEPDVTSVAKGSSSDGVLSPSGKAFVSNLTTADITAISVTKSGENYVVTVNVKDEVDPNKDNSAYGRVFDYLSKEDLINTYMAKINETVKASLPAENCTVSMSNGSAVAEITPDGKVVRYETNLIGDIHVSECTVKVVVDVSIGFDCTLKSVTTYTDFVW